MSEQLAIPQFKNWVKPTSVLEALERCLDHARIEEKWSNGQWFEVGHNLVLDRHWETNEVTPESHAAVAAWIEGRVCTDVKACAGGIIAIETLDGDALYRFLKNDEELDEHYLRDDPIAWDAVKRVATAFAEEFRHEESVHDRPGRYDDDPLGRIIRHNDAGYRPDDHHNRIVRCFERAVELEKAAQA